MNYINIKDFHLFTHLWYKLTFYISHSCTCCLLGKKQKREKNRRTSDTILYYGNSTSQACLPLSSSAAKKAARQSSSVTMGPQNQLGMHETTNLFKNTPPQRLWIINILPVVDRSVNDFGEIKFIGSSPCKMGSSEVTDADALLPDSNFRVL